MPKPRRRWIFGGIGLLTLLALPPIAWLSLTYKPRVYRQMKRAELPADLRQIKAKHFVAQSLQLRNDIVNEPVWEAAFSDQEVNAWLSEDLVTSFADQLPAEVHDPRVIFEDDRATLVFELDRGPIRSVITVVCRVRVPEDNLVALTLEKIHAGILPLPVEQLTERITYHARRHGLEVEWGRDGDAPVAFLRYTTASDRTDVILERVQILDGQLRMGGRSQHTRGRLANPTLPKRKVLQSTFPSRIRQADTPGRSAPPGPEASRRNVTKPWS